MVSAGAARLLRATLALLLALSPLAAHAADLPLRLCLNEQLGIGEENAHFSVRMVRLAQPPGVRVELHPLPWARCLVEAQRGDFDGVLGASYLPERARTLAYPLDVEGRPDAGRRMFRMGYVMLKRAGSPVRWDGRMLQGAVRPVGVERGHASVAFLRQRGIPFDENQPDLDAMLAKLRAERVDAIVVSEAQRLSLLAWRPEALGGIERAGPTLIYRDYYLALKPAWARSHRVESERFWNALAAVRTTPSFERLFAEQQGWREGEPQPKP